MSISSAQAGSSASHCASVSSIVSVIASSPLCEEIYPNHTAAAARCQPRKRVICAKGRFCLFPLRAICVILVRIEAGQAFSAAPRWRRKSAAPTVNPQGSLPDSQTSAASGYGGRWSSIEPAEASGCRPGLPEAGGCRPSLPDSQNSGSPIYASRIRR